MAFKEILFPDTIAEGARGGRGWNTDIVRNRGGYDKANANWGLPLGAWEVGLANRTLAQTQQLQGFFHGVAQGRLHSFRFRDAKDAQTRRAIALRLTSTTYQMRQRYTYGGQSLYIAVKKPLPNDVNLVVTQGATEVTNYTIDTTTGIITFGAAVDSTVTVYVTGRYHIPVRFDMDDFQPEQVDQNYFSWPSVRLVEVRL